MRLMTLRMMLETADATKLIARLIGHRHMQGEPETLLMVTISCINTIGLCADTTLELMQ